MNAVMYIFLQKFGLKIRDKFRFDKKKTFEEQTNFIFPFHVELKYSINNLKMIIRYVLHIHRHLDCMKIFLHNW